MDSQVSALLRAGARFESSLLVAPCHRGFVEVDAWGLGFWGFWGFRVQGLGFWGFGVSGFRVSLVAQYPTFKLFGLFIV